VLALIGGAGGVLAGKLGLGALVAWLPAGIPRIEDASVDGRVLLVTFAAAAVTGIFFGLGPALQLSRRAPASVLRDDPRTVHRPRAVARDSRRRRDLADAHDDVAAVRRQGRATR
jgi:hypothetical protein